MNFKKSLLVFAITGLTFTSCKKVETTENAAPVATKEVASTEKAAVVGKVETTSFHIEGMSCAVMCASKIEKELNAMDGVQKAKVDFDKKTATVEYDNAKQTPEKLVAKVESVADGKTYKVSDVKSSADHAMLMNGDPVKEKKEAPKADKTKKADKKDKKETTKKGGCCSGKKHCAEEKTM